MQRKNTYLREGRYCKDQISILRIIAARIVETNFRVCIAFVDFGVLDRAQKAAALKVMMYICIYGEDYLYYKRESYRN